MRNTIFINIAGKGKKLESHSTAKYVAKSFIWGTISKIISAAIQFISVPLLLSNFGQVDFGLIALASSINAYMTLLDMGVGTGAVKYFSEWIGTKDYNILDSVARTSISFYGIVGLINALVLIIIAFWGLSMFSLEHDQIPVIRTMFLILAFFSVINWSSSVFNQLLIANEQMFLVQQVNIIRSFIGFAVVGITLWLNWSITYYFFAYTLVNTLILVPFYLQSKKHKLVQSFVPASDWKNFGIIFKYSLAIITMGLFQMSAVHLRPIVLSIYSTEGIQIVTDYRILETITLFVISVGGSFTSIFMPKTTKLLIENNIENISNFICTATKYTTIVVVSLCIPIILNSRELLVFYVGKDFIDLSVWLELWIFIIIFGLHSSPVASLVLSTGKTKMLVFSSAIACVISLIINAVLTPHFGVGAAVIGYVVYIVIQMSFYYFYFNNHVLGLSSMKIFKSFFVPAVFSFISAFIIWYLDLSFNNLLFQIFVKTIIWFILYGGFLYFFKVITLENIKSFQKNTL
ncbi:polysaccharide biosynthesis C-terminal domain-containing protein [Flavobacterium sp. ST-87]|uniref:Polysaccharide biosynthesis C-terminal domain-containing protein n=1 Tax=Flavobacterium plantiphilum TaxID=3163297 RepID=A0ABW8XXX5_9FLAO